MAKKGTKQKVYSAEFKICVIMDMREHFLNYHEVVRKYQLGNPKQGRPPKLDKRVEEDLIAENQRLRMEIDYLKKLSALVLAEERKNGKKP